jgi:hypothetical protein
LHWVDGEALLKEEVEPWGELPLCRPGDGTIGEDGLIASSLGHHDQAEYDRQLEQGVDEPQ